MSFRLNIEEFHFYYIGNQKRILFKGWGFNEQDGSLATILLNGSEVPFERIIRTDITRDYVEFHLDPKIGFSCLIELDKKEPITSFTLKFGEEKAFEYNEPTLREATMYEDIHVNFDTVSYLENEICVNGWIASMKNLPVNVKIEDTKGNPIDFDIKFLKRKDVVDAIYGTLTQEGIDPKPGFSLRFNNEKNKKYRMVITSGSDSKTMAIGSSEQKGQSRIVRLMHMITFKKIIKGFSYLGKYGITGLKEKIRSSAGLEASIGAYGQFLQVHPLTEDALKHQSEMKFDYEPKISIVVPAYKTPKDFLEAMIRSVEEQSYDNYELCIADGSEDNSVEKLMKKHLKENSKIVYKHLDRNIGIAENTNAALDLATGEYIGLLDHDDLLSPNALFEVVKAINEDRDYEALYSDEDKVTMGGEGYFDPHFKPDFNIDYLRAINYICHFFVVKKKILDEVGRFNGEYNGSQDYDVILKCTEKAKKVKHITKVLYHWRMHPASTAQNPESKMYCYESGKKAVQAHLDRLGIDADVQIGSILGTYRVTYHLKEYPLVSIIIPTKDHIDDLDQCIQSVLSLTTYPNYEIIVVENNSTHQSTFEYYKEIEKNEHVKVIYWKDIFNYSAINNFGVEHCSGEYVVLLNNDTKLITPNWLEEMVGNCQREEVGAVGVKLYYPDETIQHCGVLIGMGGTAGHMFMGQPRNSYGYYYRTILPTDVSACTAACLMVKRSVFDELHGLKTELQVAFNDVDLCLRIREENYLIIMDPYVELYHFESKSRGYEDNDAKIARFDKETAYIKEHHAKILSEGDPYYNPNLSYNVPGFALNLK